MHYRRRTLSYSTTSRGLRPMLHVPPLLAGSDVALTSKLSKYNFLWKKFQSIDLSSQTGHAIWTSTIFTAQNQEEDSVTWQRIARVAKIHALYFQICPHKILYIKYPRIRSTAKIRYRGVASTV